MTPGDVSDTPEVQTSQDMINGDSVKEETPVKKCDVPESNDSELPKRHEDLWFEDGNVVLIANGTTAFRVHRSILSRKSVVFNDLFTVPQPANEESMDGCPVVHLSDVPSDLAALLDAMYNMSFLRADTELTWGNLRPVIVTGNKYQADGIRDEAIKVLESYKSRTDISAWDADYGDSPETTWYFCRWQENVNVANIARSMDLHKVILQTLYDCCQMTAEQLIHGISFPEGAPREQLSPDLFRICLEGQHNLIKANMRTKQALFDCTPPLCHTKDECEEARVAACRDVQTSVDALVSHDPLRPQVDWIEGKCRDAGLCESCTKFYVRRNASQRQDLLVHLGEYIKVNV